MMNTNWREEEKKGLQAKLKTDTYTVNGVLCWTSCRHQEDRPVPMHVFADADVEPPPGQKAACEAHTSAFLAAYRKAMENHVPSEEEMFEMRGAFGPGATVVNVVTGKEIKL